MLEYPQIDPVAFHLFNWPVYWYGLMYLVGFLGGWGLLNLRIRQMKEPAFNAQQVSDIVFYAALGAIIGGRLGYMLFYNWPQLMMDPLLVFQTWKGGMSFHGGFLGVLIALSIFAYKNNKHVLELTDFIAPVVPIGLGAGRIGNFINGELWGRETTMPWGMVFPQGGMLTRHPSQLYEFFLEGVMLFMILWLYSREQKPLGAVSGMFAFGYGLFRFVVEFFREPDIQIGYLYGGLTEGQLLSLPLIALGIGLIVWSKSLETNS